MLIYSQLGGRRLQKQLRGLRYSSWAVQAAETKTADAMSHCRSLVTLAPNTLSVQTHHNTVGPCVARAPGGSSGIWEQSSRAGTGDGVRGVEWVRPRAWGQAVTWRVGVASEHKPWVKWPWRMSLKQLKRKNSTHKPEQTTGLCNPFPWHFACLKEEILSFLFYFMTVFIEI